MWYRLPPRPPDLGTGYLSGNVYFFDVETFSGQSQQHLANTNFV